VRFCITVQSTPAQRYGSDGGVWRKQLDAILSEHTTIRRDIGGGSGETTAENDFEVEVDNILGEHRLFMVLERAGYTVRKWGVS
jgi:hypothetical protein